MKNEESSKRVSRLRFNFGFLIEASPGTSRQIEINYPTIRFEDFDISPLTGSFEAIRNSKGIYLTGQLQTNINTECSRCLTDLVLPINMQLDDLFYYPAHIAPPGEYGVGEDGFIDLAPLVRELSLLELPMQTFCKPDCQGLCMECGTNLNMDSCDCSEDQLNSQLSQLQALLDSDDISEG